MKTPPADMALILARLDDIDRRLDGNHVSPWLTTSEAARYLRCSTSQIERLTRRGLLPFKRQDPTTPKSPRLYHKEDLVGFLVAGKNPSVYRLTPSEKQLLKDLL